MNEEEGKKKKTGKSFLLFSVQGPLALSDYTHRFLRRNRITEKRQRIYKNRAEQSNDDEYAIYIYLLYSPFECCFIVFVFVEYLI